MYGFKTYPCYFVDEVIFLLLVLLWQCTTAIPPGLWDLCSYFIYFQLKKKFKKMVVVLLRVQRRGKALASTRVSDRFWVCCVGAGECISHLPCSSHPFPFQLTKQRFRWPRVSFEIYPGRCSLCCTLLKVSWAEAGVTNRSGQPQTESATFHWTL